MSIRQRKPKRYVQPGDRIGDLTVIAFDPDRSVWGSRFFRCRCECGAEVSIRAAAMTSGRTASCGCHQRAAAAINGRASRTHGYTAKDSPRKAYDAYGNMIQRCYRPQSRSYPLYGGRGIGVCVRWRESRSAFLADMGHPPSRDHSIDRIDNDGGYWCGTAECPECGPLGRTPNVRWATNETQHANRRNNRKYTFRGETLTLAQWAKRLGIDQRTLRMRLVVAGWPAERAMTEPLRSPLTLTWDGQTKTVEGWAASTGLPVSAIKQRVQKLRWEVGRALTTPLQTAGPRRKG